MEIKSEQEMVDFGEKFTDWISGQTATLAGLPYHSLRAKPQTENTQQTPSTATVIELIGDVGAGKTTFVRGLAKGLGIIEPITSPSFTISKSYALPTGGHLIHYDFYRLDDVGLMADNLNETINNESIVVIEWGESIKDILPENRIIISINLQNDGTRKILIKNNKDGIIKRLSKATAKNEHPGPTKTGARNATRNHTIRLFLDTSTSTTILRLNDQEYTHDFGHDLAEKLLQFIHDKLNANHQDWHDISEIIFMSGPGSFTGLRIGASIVNTLAHELQVPLYDHHGRPHPIILPEYGREANITKPKK